MKCAPRIDQLWVIVFFAGIFFVISLVPLFPHDFWWHLKVGEIMSRLRLKGISYDEVLKIALDNPLVSGFENEKK